MADDANIATVLNARQNQTTNDVVCPSLRCSVPLKKYRRPNINPIAVPSSNTTGSQLAKSSQAA